VRPLRLRVAGLRSYRREQEIDFTGVDLMAVVGDTGAGKSSLLEALTFALYGACTWDRRAGQLITSGEKTMRVELTFRAEGAEWKVTRSTSRDGYPPPIHQLEKLGSSDEPIDGRKEVDRRIEELLGLDYDTFLRAVVLPQGRFQLLLQATDAERNQILKGIFRLDLLDRVREEARSLRDRLEPELQRLREARARLLPDPTAEAEAARAEVGDAGKLAGGLDAALRELRQARAETKEAELRATELQRLGDGLAGAAQGDAADHLRHLRELEKELDREASELEGEIGSIEERETGEQKKLDDATAEGRGAAELATAEARVGGLIDELPRLRERERELERREKDQAEAADKLAELRRKLEKLEAEKQRTAEATEAAERTATEATETLRTTTDALARVREAEQQAADLRRKEEEAKGELEDARRRVAEAEAAATAAKEAVAAEEQRLENARRADAAVHAAAGCAPGDPCPVCRRDLPENFEPPRSDELDAVEKAAAEAREKLEKARGEHDRHRRDADRKEAALGAVREQRRSTEKTFEERRADLAETLPEADLGRPDEELLEPLRKAVGDAEKARKEASEKADEAAGAHRQAENELHRLESAGEKDRESLETARAELEASRRRIVEAVAGLPESYRPPTEDGTEPDVAVLEAVRGKIREAKAELEKIEKGLRQLRDQLAELRRRRERLGERRSEELHRPLRTLEAGFQRLHHLAAEAATTLDLGDGAAPPAPPEELTAAGLEEWAGELATVAGKLRERLEAERSEAHQRTLESRERAAEILRRASSTGEEELETKLVGARAGLETATARLAEAERQIPLAADLDHRIGRAGPFLDALRELAALLTDGKFIGHVVQRKQQALLGVATTLLRDMTGDRFGFAETFEIVDRLSGQPRNVKTLSGGETFLASLALALGLVELAGRGGGRLDALFLDEGFGTLDADSLGEALEALTRQAETGRLVAVISHLRTVAENIEHVLQVTKTPRGSQARWLAPEERDAAIGEEAAGLVA